MFGDRPLGTRKANIDAADGLFGGTAIGSCHPGNTQAPDGAEAIAHAFGHLNCHNFTDCTGLG